MIVHQRETQVVMPHSTRIAGYGPAGPYPSSPEKIALRQELYESHIALAKAQDDAVKAVKDEKTFCDRRTVAALDSQLKEFEMTAKEYETIVRGQAQAECRDAIQAEQAHLRSYVGHAEQQCVQQLNSVAEEKDKLVKDATEVVSQYHHQMQAQ